MTGPLAPRVVDCPAGNAYKVSVTGFTFSVIWYDKHSAGWLAALAPLSGCAGLPPQAGVRWWRQPPKGEYISDARRAVVKVLYKLAPSII